MKLKSVKYEVLSLSWPVPGQRVICKYDHLSSCPMSTGSHIVDRGTVMTVITSPTRCDEQGARNYFYFDAIVDGERRVRRVHVMHNDLEPETLFGDAFSEDEQ